MRAVNLIPSDQRRGQSVGVGRSEGGAYAVLALLVAVAALAVLYGKAHRDVTSRTAEAATVNAQAQRAKAEASQLAPYTSFVALRTQREQAVAALVDSRFDWAHAFHEFGRVLTGQTEITSLSGSIAATEAAPASAAATTTATTPATALSTTPAPAATATPAASASVTSATPAGSVPTFALAGCATSQNAVATMLERLRLIDGVDTVTLLSSTKSTGTGASTGGCPTGGPAFSVNVTFDPLPSATAAAAAVKPKASSAQTVSDTTAAKASSGGAN
jgi:Tfp pilus assembly protein PilN